MNENQNKIMLDGQVMQEPKKKKTIGYYFYTISSWVQLIGLATMLTMMLIFSGTPDALASGLFLTLFVLPFVFFAILVSLFALPFYVKKHRPKGKELALYVTAMTTAYLIALIQILAPIMAGL